MKYRPNIKRIGYQHSSVAKRIFHYYSERTQESTDFSEPLPDYFAVNGEIPKQELTKSYGDKIITLEALRQLQTKESKKQRVFEKYHNLQHQILLIGSYDRYEAIKILDFVSEAIKRTDGRPIFQSHEVIVKSHPSCDLSKEVRIRDSENSSKTDIKMSISNENIDDILPYVEFVIVGSSTAAIDAVRNNCEIYVPIFSDHIILSPLSGYDDFFTYVSEPNELGRLIDDHYVDRDLIREERDREMKDKFIEEFWLLEKSLSNWKKVINNSLK